MLRNAPQSSRDWLTVALVAAAGFLFFSAGSIGLARVNEEPVPMSAATVTTRIVVSIVVAVLLFVGERRRERQSVDAALIDGIQLAAIVIVTGNLVGTPDAGASLALRSAMILVGLPLLDVVTHLLARHRSVGGT